MSIRWKSFTKLPSTTWFRWFPHFLPQSGTNLPRATLARSRRIPCLKSSVQYDDAIFWFKNIPLWHDMMYFEMIVLEIKLITIKMKSRILYCFIGMEMNDLHVLSLSLSGFYHDRKLSVQFSVFSLAQLHVLAI